MFLQKYRHAVQANALHNNDNDYHYIRSFVKWKIIFSTSFIDGEVGIAPESRSVLAQMNPISVPKVDS
jgi:hypothetical protein